jgi:hypothetical protein
MADTTRTVHLMLTLQVPGDEDYWSDNDVARTVSFAVRDAAPLRPGFAPVKRGQWVVSSVVAAQDA